MKRLIYALLVACCAGMVVLALPLPQTYPQLIFGELSVLKGGKSNDLLVFPVVFVVFACSYLFQDVFRAYMVKVGERLRRIGKAFSVQWEARVGDDARANVAALARSDSLALLCVLLSLYAGSAVLGQPLSFVPFAVVVCGAGALISWAARRRRDSAVVPDDIAPAFWGALLFAFCPFGVAVALTRFFPSEVLLWNGVSAFALAGGALTAFVLVLTAGFVFTRVQSSCLVAGALLAGQAGLPLLVWTFYPVTLVTPAGPYTPHSTVWLPIFLTSLMLLTYGDLYRRWFLARQEGQMQTVLSPLCLAVAVGTVCSNVTYIPVVSSDDYHFGESLLGVFNYAAGKLPYIDYFPPHGFIADDLGLLLSYVFYDGTAATVRLGDTLGTWLMFIVVMLAVCRLTKNRLLSVVVCVAAMFNSFYIYLVPLLALLFFQPLPEHRARFCFIWLCLSLVTILAVPPQGMVLVCASSVLALVHFVYAARLTPAATGRYTALALGLGVLALLTPVGPMFLNIGRYVLENGSTNQQAWGIPWRLSFEPFTLKAVLHMGLSSLWFVVIVLFFLLLVHRRAYYFDKHLRCLTLLAVILFSMLMIPYTMGRLDPSGLARSFVFSLIAVCVILPLAMQHAAKQYLTLALCTACFLIAASYPFPMQYDRFRVGIETLPYALTNGADFGVPRLGTGVVEPGHADLIKRVRAELAEHPDAPFYNATNLNALYYYADTLPFVATTAPLNSPTTQQQQRLVEQLQKHPTAIILLSVPEKPFMWELSTRTHHVYRYILENYIPYESEKLIWARPNTERRALTPEERALYIKAFPTRDLGWTPTMWGAAEAGLGNELVEVVDLPNAPNPKNHVTLNADNTYTVNGKDVYLMYDLASANLKGKDAGILRFEIDGLPSDAQPRIQIFWWGDDMTGPEADRSLSFKADNGVQLVPLDSFPDYLLLNKVKGVRIDVDGVPLTKRFSLHGVKLLQRRLSRAD